MSLFRSVSYGYTLIELIVVIGIVTVLTGASITGYIAYNERQVVRNTSDELVVFLESAKQKASVRQTPDNCDFLRGFQVVSTANNLDMFALCSLTQDGSYSAQDNPISSIVFPQLVSVSAIDITFLTLFDGVIISQPINGRISIVADDTSQTVIVSEGGAIEVEIEE